MDPFQRQNPFQLGQQPAPAPTAAGPVGQQPATNSRLAQLQQFLMQLPPEQVQQLRNTLMSAPPDQRAQVLQSAFQGVPGGADVLAGAAQEVSQQKPQDGQSPPFNPGGASGPVKPDLSSSGGQQTPPVLPPTMPPAGPSAPTPPPAALGEDWQALVDTARSGLTRPQLEEMKKGLTFDGNPMNGYTNYNALRERMAAAGIDVSGIPDRSQYGRGQWGANGWEPEQATGGVALDNAGQQTPPTMPPAPSSLGSAGAQGGTGPGGALDPKLTQQPKVVSDNRQGSGVVGAVLKTGGRPRQGGGMGAAVQDAIAGARNAYNEKVGGIPGGAAGRRVRQGLGKMGGGLEAPPIRPAGPQMGGASSVGTQIGNPAAMRARRMKPRLANEGGQMPTAGGGVRSTTAPPKGRRQLKPATY